MASPRPGRPARNLYQLLGVPREASRADITHAYRRQARAIHPDSRPQDDAAAPARFRAVAEAYQILSDPARRADYDRALPHRPAPGRDPVLRPDTSTGTMVPVPWQAPPWLDPMTGPVRGPGPALRAGPVRVDPPGTRPSRGAQRAEHASLTVRAELTGSYLNDGRDRP